MAYEQKEGDISLFRNDKKQPGTNQPDMRGTALINGQKYKISAWTKGEGQKRFLAGKIELDTYTPAQPAPAPVQLPESEPIKVKDDNDGLPF